MSTLAGQKPTLKVGDIALKRMHGYTPSSRAADGGEAEMTLAMQEQKTGLPLHYVGMRVYTTSTFTAEALRLGVQRALPASALRSLRWGETVLLAEWRRIGGASQVDAETGEQTRKGAAIVFGCFTVDRVVHKYEPASAYQELLRRLTVVRVVAPSNGNERVSRRCGSYVSGGCAYVSDDIATIVEKGEQVALELGARVKWFVAGRFHRVEPRHVLTPVSFTRSLMRVDSPSLREAAERRYAEHGKTGEVLEIYSYEQHRYLPKAVRGNDDLGQYAEMMERQNTGV